MPTPTSWVLWAARALERAAHPVGPSFPATDHVHDEPCLYETAECPDRAEADRLYEDNMSRPDR